MAATTLFTAPILPHHHISTQSFNTNKPWHPLSSTTSLTKSSLIRASSSTPTVDQQEDQDDTNSSTNPDTFTDQSQPIPIGGCKACGKAEIERGCNGEGRVQGGIATVPGFRWWPIKAYRPCPGFVATGGRYRRQGQTLDEVAGFVPVSRKSKPAATTTATTTTTVTVGTENQSSERKEGGRKFKR